MEDEKKVMTKLDIAWNVLGVCVIAVMVTVLVTFLLAPHQISGYYLKSDANNGMATCVIADISWAPDSKCYCTNNPQQAIQDVATLNAGLR